MHMKCAALNSHLLSSGMYGGQSEEASCDVCCLPIIERLEQSADRRRGYINSSLAGLLLVFAAELRSGTALRRQFTLQNADTTAATRGVK